MIPFLHPKNANFETSAIGALSDIISCYITEERNGIYEAEFKYPEDGILFDRIQIGCFIECIYGDVEPEKEYYEIYSESKTINGIVTFSCRHITYRTLYEIVSPFETTVSAVGAAARLKNERMNGQALTLVADGNTEHTFSVKYPASLKTCLGGIEGSLLDVYGGEFYYTHHRTAGRFSEPYIYLMSARGEDRGVYVDFGLNMRDYKYDCDSENVVDGVVCYYVDDTTCVYSDITTIVEGVAYRIKTVDCSDKYETPPTVPDLNADAVAYINKHENDLKYPEMNLDISFVELKYTEEFKRSDINLLSGIELCDTIHVRLRDGSEIQAKVVKLVWNVLLERNEQITISSLRKDLVTMFVNLQDKVK